MTAQHRLPFTDRGIECLQELLADIRTWNGGILGFLRAEELEEQNCILFRNAEEWRLWLTEKTKQTVPEEIWDSTFDVNGTPLSVLVRAASVDLPPRNAGG